MTAQQVIFNDVNAKINGIFRYFQGQDPDTLIRQINAKIAAYQLSKTNEAGFRKLRADYNRHPHPLDLYVLVAYSFNYQFRFNQALQYNNPFGRNRSHFSSQMAAHLRQFVTRLNQLDAVFTDQDFRQLDWAALTSGDFVYADPPYLITLGSYNDGHRGFVDWGVTQEQALYARLDELAARGIRFALSNVTYHKGKRNELLLAWSQRYTTHLLTHDYRNASHNTQHAASQEVLITNE